MESPVLPGSADASNPVDLWDWAYLYCWKDWLAKLAETALPEKWDFSPNDRDEKDDRPRYAILASYLKYTFWRRAAWATAWCARSIPCQIGPATCGALRT